MRRVASLRGIADHARVGDVRRVACVHCGLDVPPGRADPAGSEQFCCEGCRAAFAILHSHGLAQYYALPQRRDRPVQRTGRSFEEFDHAAFHDLYVTRADSGLSRVELYLEGVHCASCVWLVERIPLVVPGVMRTELNVRRSLATVEWDAGAVRLSEIARSLDALGYTPHPFRGVRRDAMRRREDRAALVRIGVAGAIAINVMLPTLALYSGLWSGMDASYVRLFRWIGLGLTVPAVLYPGRVFFTGALAALRTRTLHMDLPIAIALGAGLVRGAINTVTDQGPIYFDGITLLIFLLLCGRLLQQRGQRAASEAAELLHSLTPANARILDDTGRPREVPAEAVLPDQILAVHPGETFPADGEVTEGRSAVDAALLTGESRPASVGPGDRVFAGTLNVSAPLRVRVTAAGETRRIAAILRQVEESATRRAPVVLLANRMAGWFVGAVMVLAALTYLYWQQRDAARAMDSAIALLLVTCPCALALATPLAVAAAIGQAARAGILVKSGEALQELARPALLVLDKTGTVTQAATSLEDWEGPEWVKPLVLDAERGSTHPVAEGFRRAWKPGGRAESARLTHGMTSFATARGHLSVTIDGRTRLEPAPRGGAADVEHVAGGGIRGAVSGRRVVIGSPAFVRRETGASGAGAPPARSALTPVWVAVDGQVVGRAGFGDPLRPDAAAAVHALRSDGWRVSLLSGDASPVVADVGRRLDIAPDECTGDASPEAKRRFVERARQVGRVIMVGDGVNDAGAIAAASVGVGVHGGAEACLATADVYLSRPGLAPLVQLTRGARRTMTVIRRAVVFSLGYNAVGATLAITGTINPLMAAVLMPASSLTVLLIAWRSRTFEAARA